MQNRRIRLLMAAFTVLLLFMALYLVWFQMFEADQIADNPYNARKRVDDSQTIRGKILDRHGAVLAWSDEPQTRQTKYRYAFSPVTGYYSAQYGRSGIEASFHRQLVGVKEENVFDKLRGDETNVGNDVVLTIHEGLQLKAYELLEDHKGAIVAMNPKTGEILAMASRPTYNVQNLEEEWEDLIAREDAPLLNRATQGLYTPGSIQKVPSAVALLEQGIDLNYNDTGEETVEGFTYHNFGEKSYGEIGLKEALVHSVNTYFAHFAQEVGPIPFQEVLNRFGFGKKLLTELPCEASRNPYQAGMPATELSSASFGQGKTLVTPLQMASVISTVANNGLKQDPILVQRTVRPDGEVEEVYHSKATRVFPETLAKELKEDLVAVIEDGSKAATDDLVIGGKTGTAENSSGNNHAWFIGFAGEDSEFAVAIILEEEGQTGAAAAAPIAGELFRYYRDNMQ